MNKTLWMQRFSKVKKNINISNFEVDVLIIGGGISGLSNAFYLKDKNLKVALIEKDKVGLGATARSTAKITFMQQLIYQKLIKSSNFKTSKLYYESQKEAISELNNTIKEHKIDCNYEIVPSITFTNNTKEIKVFKKEEEFFNKVNQKYEIVDSINYFPCKYGIKVNDTAVFNPVKFCKSIKEILKNKIDIYEGVKCIDIKNLDNKYIIKTDKNIIKANKVIICTHYPFFIIPGLIPFKTHIERDYVCVSEIDNHNEFSAITYSNKPLHSIRFHKDNKNYIIYTSSYHKLTNNIDYDTKYKLVKQRFNKYINKDVKYTWVNHDLITNDYLPLIGEVKNNLYVATGFNTWGMTNGWISGKVISDIILNYENKYINLFSPKRSINLTKIKNFIIDSFNYAKVYLKTTLIKNHKFYNNVYIKYENGIPFGIYKDENNIIHKCFNKCPHFKCNLIFNNIEKTWDCPCHGSRFDIDGNLITGPSTKDIKNQNN